VPEILSDEENWRVLDELVEHFEGRMPHPKLLKDGQPTPTGVACPAPSSPAAAPAPKASAQPSSNGHSAGPDIDALVRTITDQVMGVLNSSAR